MPTEASNDGKVTIALVAQEVKALGAIMTEVRADVKAQGKCQNDMAVSMAQIAGSVAANRKDIDDNKKEIQAQNERIDLLRNIGFAWNTAISAIATFLGIRQ